MTQHDPGGDTDAKALPAEAWRERFRQAFGDSPDLYTELFAMSPAPMMVEDWSAVRPIVDQLRQTAQQSIERQILDSPGLAEKLWNAMAHVAANPAILAVNRVPSEEFYDDYADEFEPSITPALASVISGMADGIYDNPWPEMKILAHDETPIRIKGRVFVPPAYRDTWRVVLFTYEDITETRRREEELLQAKRAAEQAALAKAEFLATMSHEFRTPLNAIMGFSQVLQSEAFGPLGDHRYTRYAEDILASGEHLLGLIEDILDLAQAEAGKLVLNEETIDLADITSQAIRLLQDRAMRAGVSIDTHLPEDLPLLRVDPRRLRQLLINLLTNAIKFTGPGGAIVITAGYRADRTLAVCVEDSGQGMNEDEAALAMEPFGQVRRSHHGNVEGWGLGLPIAKHLAELHDSHIELESTPGKGTQVRVVLPPERVVTG